MGEKIRWIAFQEIGLEGQAWQDQKFEQPFDRIPLSGKGKLPESVWSNSHSPTGMSVSFVTDSPVLFIRRTFESAQLEEHNFNNCSFSGFDLYAERNGKLRWVCTTNHKYGDAEEYPLNLERLEGRHVYRLYLPCRNRLLKAELGIAENAFFEPVSPRPLEEGIVYYGSSIIHGAYTSHAGICPPAWLGRRFGRPSWNFGFSGAAKMEPEVADLLGTLHPAVFILDPMPNMRLEEILIYIKQEEGFKSIGYTVDDGKIIVKAEPFSHLTSSVSIGLGMDAGIKGSIEEGRPSLFYFKPHASVFFDINLPEYYGTLIAGLDITNYTALFASYYYNFASSFSAFASARVGVGDLSMLSIADYLNRMDTSDFLFSAEGGVAYDYMNRLRLELSLDLDLISLGSLKSFDDVNMVRARMVYFDPKVNFNLKYRLLDPKNLYSNGIDIDFDCDLYLRSPFMYDIRLSFESIIPSPVPSSKFIISGKAYVLRGNENIGESYVTGKSGNLSRDYLLLSIGGRVLLSESIYMDVSIFSEGYESRNYPDRFWPRIENAFLVPLSLLNDWAAGFSLSLGFNNEWGNLELFIDITHRGAYSFGVRLK